jgi:regulation of enolase protein 1 (concanavalin A-like superfamily)
MGLRFHRLQRHICLSCFVIIVASSSTARGSDAPLPTNWTSADIGAVGQRGSAMFNNPERTDWTLSGAGADIWGTSDAFHYLYRPLNGPGYVRARVLSIENTDRFAKAGIMMRESLAADSRHVLLNIRPNGTWEFLTRLETGGPTTAKGGTGAGVPRRLMLLRGADRIAALVQFDNGDWIEVGLATISMTSNVYVGLAVTSHKSTALNTSRFDGLETANLEGEGAPQPWTDWDIGNTGLRGFTYNGGLDNIYLSAAGTDIWGREDAFRYVSQWVDGDTDIVAYVTHIEDTHPFAKAGLMLRQSLTPDSPHVILDVTPDGGIEFMTRRANGAETTFIAGGNAAVPVWLRLTRTGAIITGSFSIDGASWTTVGSVTTAISDSAHLGLAVTSHDPTKSNAAAFEYVGMAGGVQQTPGSQWDIVWYAADARSEDIHGQWVSVCCDSASPEGIKLVMPVAGFAALDEPLASPDDYVEVVFNAKAGLSYTLWLRLRAKGNSKWNDSVWVQFSDAHVNGSPKYMTGTTDGLLVNLATNAAASSLNDWGWVNGAYWLSQPASVTFGSTGTQTLRVQVREDGVELDQIVLSPSRYQAAAPGTRTRDSTIVPRP